LFSFSLCHFFGWIEIKARQLPNTYALKKRNIEKQLDSIHILALGSSHAFDDIDPEWFHVADLISLTLRNLFFMIHSFV